MENRIVDCGICQAALTPTLPTLYFEEMP